MQVQDNQRLPAAPAGAGATFSWGSIVEGGPLQDNEFERRLAVGANIACRLRGAVREQLGGCRQAVRVSMHCHEHLVPGSILPISHTSPSWTMSSNPPAGDHEHAGDREHAGAMRCCTLSMQVTAASSNC